MNATQRDGPDEATLKNMSLLERVAANPTPAARWFAVIAVLVLLELGAVMNAVMTIVPWAGVGSYLPDLFQGAAGVLAGIGNTLADLPTLLSRSVLDNSGYQLPSGSWEGTTFGLPPAVVWFLRVVLIYVYGFAWLVQAWRGYVTYRDHYRAADWAPIDDMVNRYRHHTWGLFGLVVIFAFVIMAVFAPALGPTTVDKNIASPYEHKVEYFNEESGSVEKVFVGDANRDAQSRGAGGDNVGPLQYDKFGRFHPFGTMPNGKDLFTFMVAGARISVVIGVLTLGISGLVAVTFALFTAYYKGLVDLAVVIAGDSVQAMPQLLFIIMASFILSGTWLAEIYDGALVLALLFGFTGWPTMWRAVRGPALQVSEREWVDAAKSFGQRPTITMRKHMFPYVAGYFLIYASLMLGGVIIGVAGLSFLGLGVSPPTPEWGRAVSMGQPYVATKSWHISLLPGIMVVIVVTAFNALGDGIRDAIDPQSDASTSGDETVAAGGGA